jgi:hypothetical protein
MFQFLELWGHRKRGERVARGVYSLILSISKRTPIVSKNGVKVMMAWLIGSILSMGAPSAGAPVCR